MLKTMVLAGLLAMGTTAQASAQGAAADVAVVPPSLSTGAAQRGCHDASDAWLPGTLQIDERARATDPAPPARQVDRAPAPIDCVLV